jgi:hypothetical protein
LLLLSGAHNRSSVKKTPAKKGQGETNQRLDALVDEQRKTNQLLTDLLQAPKTR